VNVGCIVYLNILMLNSMKFGQVLCDVGEVWFGFVNSSRFTAVAFRRLEWLVTGLSRRTAGAEFWWGLNQLKLSLESRLAPYCGHHIFWSARLKIKWILPSYSFFIPWRKLYIKEKHAEAFQLQAFFLVRLKFSLRSVDMKLIDSESKDQRSSLHGLRLKQAMIFRVDTSLCYLT